MAARKRVISSWATSKANQATNLDENSRKWAGSLQLGIVCPAYVVDLSAIEARSTRPTARPNWRAVFNLTLVDFEQVG